MSKELSVTCDFADDLLVAETKLQPDHLDEMMRYAASLGATRFEWIVDTLWNFYRADNPLGYDLLQVACEAAHRHGLRFDAVYKPFEDGLCSPVTTLPDCFPRWPGDGALATDTGIIYAVRKFVADHPEYRLSRRPGDGEDPGGRLAEIRLISADDSELQLSPGDIAFYGSTNNGNFQRIEAELTVSTRQEWRLYSPFKLYHQCGDKPSTILSFKGFDLPEEVRYLEVRCASTSGSGTFANYLADMVELVNDRGEVIPCSPSTQLARPDNMYKVAKRMEKVGVADYLSIPEVRERLADYETFEALFEENNHGMYTFEPQYELYTLDAAGAGRIGLHRGKPTYHPSCLHPIYPEVRQHWLDDIEYCLERGVDGVNIRISRHGGMNEPWDYGYNAPVVEQLKNPRDSYEAALINGGAFDRFMEDAAELVHSHDRELGVHLCGLILDAVDKLMVPPKPHVFSWNWEKWVRELVDYTEFHKTNFFNFRHATELIDHFGYVVREAGKPFIYQSGQGSGSSYSEGPSHFLRYELEWAKAHPHITCFTLYETAAFFKLTEDGNYEGSPQLSDIVKEHWHGDS